MARDEKKVVVGIDLGDSHSGFAYAFTADRRTVLGSTEWPGQAVAYPKTASALLYQGRRLAAWGYQAAQLQATDGGTLQTGFKHTFDVPAMTAFLGRLSEVIGRRLEEAGGVRKKDVRWCFAVPSAWQKKERQALLDAVVKAKLVSRARLAKDVILVPNSVAAALTCQERERHGLRPGSRVLVVDAGASTRATLYDVTRQRTLRRLTDLRRPAVLGAADVDRLFIDNFLTGKLGAEALSTYAQEEPVEMVALLSDWERLKCAFEPGASLGAVFLPFRPRLFKLLRSRFPDVYQRLVDNREDEGLALEPNDMEALFRPAVASIVGEIRQALAGGQADFLYLVGGFATSHVVQEAIRFRLTRRHVGEIFVPPVPGAAMMEGAVSWGLEASSVRHRRSRLAYGCGCEMPFEKGADPEEKRLASPDLGKDHCADRFFELIAAGEIVEPGHEVKLTFSPMAPAQSELLIDFFAAPRGGVRHVDENGVERVGECRVPLPSSGDARQRVVELRLVAGENDLEVEAVDLASRKKTRTTIYFSSTYSPERIGD